MRNSTLKITVVRDIGMGYLIKREALVKNSGQTTGPGISAAGEISDHVFLVEYLGNTYKIYMINRNPPHQE